MKFDVDLSGNLLAGLIDMCQQKVSHISFYIKNYRLLIGIVTPEFFKIIPTICNVEVENVSIRISKSIVQTLLLPSSLRFEIADNIVITQSHNSKQMLKITAPFEMDFNDELFDSVLESRDKCGDHYYEIGPILSLKDLVPLSKIGLHLSSNLAFIVGNGYQVYKKTGLDLRFIMTQDCVKNLLKMSKGGTLCKIYAVGGFTVFENAIIIMGWLGTRQSMTSEYDLLQSQIPIVSVNANLTNVKEIVKLITINKTNPPTCTVSLADQMIYVSEGTQSSYAISLNLIDAPDLADVPDVKVQFSVFKDMLSALNVPVNSAELKIFQTFIYIKTNEIELLIVRGR